MASSQLNAAHYYLYPSPVWGWRGLAPQLMWKSAVLLKAAKLQPCAPPEELVCVLSSLQPQGMLLLACLIASLIKTWLSVSNMISPAEHLKLSQQLCVCVLCTPQAAKTYGSCSGCPESKHTEAAQVLCLCSDVPKISNSSLTSLRGYPSMAGRTQHMSTHLLWCQVQQPGFVTISPGVWASGTVFCFHFLNALQNIQIFTKTALMYNFRAVSASDCVVELRDGSSRVSVITGFFSSVEKYISHLAFLSVKRRFKV